MPENRDFWCGNLSFTRLWRALTLEIMFGEAVDGKIWGFEENWHGLEEEGNAEDVGISGLPARISR